MPTLSMVLFFFSRNDGVRFCSRFDKNATDAFGYGALFDERVSSQGQLDHHDPAECFSRVCTIAYSFLTYRLLSMRGLALAP